MVYMTACENRIQMETFVSVETATQLQILSMQRFRSESSSDMKLRRFLGHVSINRRSTEILRTATFDDEMLDEMEDQYSYNDEQESMPDATPEPFSSELESIIESDSEDEIELPLEVDDAVTFQGLGIQDWNQCQKESTALTLIKSDTDLMLSTDEDWMYDVLDLQIDYSAFLQPIPTTPLPRAVALQVWRIILESLVGFARRRAEFDQIHDARKLEAYGIMQQNQMIAWGLDPKAAQYEWYGGQLQLAT